MKLYRKFIMMTCGVAVATSAMTVMAMQEVKDLHDAFSSTNIEAPGEGETETVYHGERAQTTPVGLRASTDTDFTRAAEEAINGVVSIKSYVTARRQGRSGVNIDDFFNDPFFDFFFGNPNNRRQQQEEQKKKKETEEPEADDEPQQQLGLGSGVIIAPDGYIVTNAHVIEGAERLEVTLNDNSSYNAKVIGSDKATDLALIKIEADGLPVIRMGDSDKLKVGEWVLAVGNPFGFTSTVTTGIVSAKARNMSSVGGGRSMGIESYIQTDAAVNPGNSGGALVNLDGELVGINAAIYSQTGNYAGYSFAIPTSLVTKVVDDIKQYGAVQRPFLGLTYRELTPKLRKDKGITATNDGLYVEDVAEGKAASKAGLKKGDVIIALNGEHIPNAGKLFDQLNRHRPGDEVTVTYVRDGKVYDTKVTLYNDLGSTKPMRAPDASSLGATFKPVGEETLKQLGLKSGLEVADVKDGKFKKAGIYKGFIITDINNVRVTKPEDVEKLYLEIVGQKEYDHVMFITGVYPSGSKRYYAVDLAD